MLTCVWCAAPVFPYGCSNPTCPSKSPTLVGVRPTMPHPPPVPIDPRERLIELEEALQKYGAHTPECSTHQSKVGDGKALFRVCDCGLDEIIWKGREP